MQRTCPWCWHRLPNANSSMKRCNGARGLDFKWSCHLACSVPFLKAAISTDFWAEHSSLNAALTSRPWTKPWLAPLHYDHLAWHWLMDCLKKRQYQYRPSFEYEDFQGYSRLGIIYQCLRRSSTHSTPWSWTSFRTGNRSGMWFLWGRHNLYWWMTSKQKCHKKALAEYLNHEAPLKAAATIVFCYCSHLNSMYKYHVVCFCLSDVSQSYIVKAPILVEFSWSYLTSGNVRNIKSEGQSLPAVGLISVRLCTHLKMPLRLKALHFCSPKFWPQKIGNMSGLMAAPSVVRTVVQPSVHTGIGHVTTAPSPEPRFALADKCKILLWFDFMWSTRSLLSFLSIPDFGCFGDSRYCCHWIARNYPLNDCFLDCL